VLYVPDVENGEGEKGKRKGKSRLDDLESERSHYESIASKLQDSINKINAEDYNQDDNRRIIVEEAESQELLGTDEEIVYFKRRDRSKDRARKKSSRPGYSKDHSPDLDYPNNVHNKRRGNRNGSNSRSPGSESRDLHRYFSLIVLLFRPRHLRKNAS
jgi:hypothetical protein